MEITPLAIEGAWLAHSPVWSDQRGYFREWFKVADVEKVTGRSFSAEQGNISQSSRGTVRGIHYSIAQRGQAKWVTCVTGSIKESNSNALEIMVYVGFVRSLKSFPLKLTLTS